VLNKSFKPSFAEEKILEAQGYRLIAGIDEAGRGPLAGPVVAAAVILPCGVKAGWLDEVRESKQLSSARRNRLFEKIREIAISVGVGASGNDVIDSYGIVPATRVAMKLAVNQLSEKPDYLLIDYMNLPEIPLPQKGITNGDGQCFSIACASIVAKVARDYLMTELDKKYPGYDFAKHKGYGTMAHLALLRHWGPSPIHRRTFKPVKDLIQE